MLILPNDLRCPLLNLMQAMKKPNVFIQKGEESGKQTSINYSIPKTLQYFGNIFVRVVLLLNI